jgi:hypothetical protein
MSSRYKDSPGKEKGSLIVSEINIQESYEFKEQSPTKDYGHLVQENQDISSESEEEEVIVTEEQDTI